MAHNIASLRCGAARGEPWRYRLLRGLRQHMLAKTWHHLLGHELHRLSLPIPVGTEPIDAGHQERTEGPDLLAERDQLVEHGLARAVEHAAVDDRLGVCLSSGH